MEGVVFCDACLEAEKATDPADEHKTAKPKASLTGEEQ